MSGNAQTIARPAASTSPRASGPAAVKSAPQVLIATVNRPAGSTGVHTHTRIMSEGLTQAGIAGAVESPFSRGPRWLPVFAIRRIFHALNKSWSTRWYRRWHRAALRDNLLKRLNGKRFDGAILAQCPLSADAGLEVRSRLGMDFKVAMVCHFNFSEADEYREQGVLDNQASYQEILDFEKRVLSEVDRVIYVSKWAQRTVEETRGIRTRASSVVWNGVPQTSPDPVSRESIGLAKDDLVLMNVGTLENRKNQVGLVDLFELIAKAEPRARMVLVGEGPDRAAITQKLSQKGLSDRVKLLGHRSDVPALLAAADLYIHYSSLENCPVVLLEAARAKLAPVAIPAGGVPELLHALGGVALDQKDLKRSLAAVLPLLKDAALREYHGNAARQSFDRHFTREAMIDGYQRALGLSKPGEAR